MEKRPAFEEIKSFEELSKYYWYRSELVLIFRQLGICAVGYKADLNKRIEKYFRGNLGNETKSPRLDSPVKNVKKKPSSRKKTLPELTLKIGLIESGFCFNQRFREFFSEQTGIKNFKFTADMAASARKARESDDTSFTLGDLLEVYYGRKTYACYDRVSLQWNKFVKDFCADPATARFPNKLKTAACLRKKVRESTREKVYKHELLEEFKEEI